MNINIKCCNCNEHFQSIIYNSQYYNDVFNVINIPTRWTDSCMAFRVLMLLKKSTLIPFSIYKNVINLKLIYIYKD